MVPGRRVQSGEAAEEEAQRWRHVDHSLGLRCGWGAAVDAEASGTAMAFPVAEGSGVAQDGTDLGPHYESSEKGTVRGG
jgi:hypothetical protein